MRPSLLLASLSFVTASLIADPARACEPPLPGLTGTTPASGSPLPANAAIVFSGYDLTFDKLTVTYAGIDGGPITLVPASTKMPALFGGEMFWGLDNIRFLEPPPPPGAVVTIEGDFCPDGFTSPMCLQTLTFTAAPADSSAPAPAAGVSYDVHDYVDYVPDGGNCQSASDLAIYLRTEAPGPDDGSTRLLRLDTFTDDALTKIAFSRLTLFSPDSGPQQLRLMSDWLGGNPITRPFCFRLTALDAAGNAAAPSVVCTPCRVHVDAQPPTDPFLPPAEPAWTTADVVPGGPCDEGAAGAGGGAGAGGESAAGAAGAAGESAAGAGGESAAGAGGEGGGGAGEAGKGGAAMSGMGGAAVSGMGGATTSGMGGSAMSGMGGSAMSGMGGASPTGPAVAPVESDEGGGCGCRAAGRPAQGWALAAGLAALFARRRRARLRRPLDPPPPRCYVAPVEEGQAGLKRTLGPLMIWALGVGYVISGMYFGWNLGLEAGGPYGMLAATLLVTVMYLAFVLGYAELACAMPRADGAALYAHRALGPQLGFVAGAAQLIEFVFAPPAIAAAIGAYISLVVPAIKPLPAAMAAYAIFTALNMWGVQHSARFELVVTVLAVAELLIFSGITLPAFSLEAFGRDAHVSALAGLAPSVPFAIWFYLAIEGIANVAEETVDPHKALSRGFSAAMLTLIALALLTFFGAVGVAGWRAIVYPPGATTPSDSPLPLALGQLVGPSHPMYHLLVGIGLCGLVASFHGIILVAARTTFAFGRVGYAPRFLGQLHKVRGTPGPALIVNMLIGFVALLAGRTGDILTLSVFGALTMYALSMVSLFALRRREPSLDRPFKVPLYPFVPAVALVLSVAALVAMVVYNRNVALVYAALLGAGLLAAQPALRKARTHEPTVP